jgi:hypothetical protein
MAAASLCLDSDIRLDFCVAASQADLKALKRKKPAVAKLVFRMTSLDPRVAISGVSALAIPSRGFQPVNGRENILRSQSVA